MLARRQVATLWGIGVVFWLGDVAWIRLLPALAIGPVWGSIVFLISVPVAWLCVWLTRVLANLDRERIVPGITLMVAVAALLHGVALRWAASLYGSDHAARLGAGWLLWIYGLILGCVLLTVRKSPLVVARFSPDGSGVV